MMDDSEVIADLTAVGILGYLNDDDLEALKYHGEFGEYGDGEVIVEEGVRQYNLYIIVSGQCEIVLGSGANEMVVGDIGPGSCIGEVSILEPGDATATVRVTGTAVLWKLDVEQLQAFFEKLPVAAGQLMLGIAQLLCQRLRTANQTIMQSKNTPKQLGVRAGRVQAPIRVTDLVEDKPASGGLFSNLMGKKQKKPTISTEIKK